MPGTNGLAEKQIWLNIQRNIIIVRVVQQWNRLPWYVVVGYPLLEISEQGLNRHFSGMLIVFAFCIVDPAVIKQFGLVDLHNPLQLCGSVIPGWSVV